MNSEQFSRTRRLIGSGGADVLRNSRVVVFGVGGVGSHCIEALIRAGVGTLAMVDSDRVAVSNINRQSIAFLSTVGQPKVDVMAKMLADINPEAQVTPVETFILPENVDALFSSLPFTPDYIVDAIDTVSAKLAIAVWARDHGVPMIASMGTGNKLHGERFEIADISATSVCPLCRVMRKELKKRGIVHLKVLYSKEEPLKPADDGAEPRATGRPSPGSISFVPPVAGLLIAGEVVRDLLARSPEDERT